MTNPENPSAEAVTLNTESKFKRKLWNAYHGVKYWLFLNIWCRHFYRPVSKLMHRFNLHYAPPNWLTVNEEKREHWCQWCGLRGTTYNRNHAMLTERAKEER